MKALLFDFGGTLDGDGLTWLDRFYAIYKEEGLEISREAFAKAFYAADDALPARHDLKKRGFEETVALQVADVCAQIAPGDEKLAKQAVRRFVDDCRGHFRRNRPVLERLRKKGPLGIVSNFYGNLDAVLSSEGLSSLFVAVADSGVIGTQKPEAAIFHHALQKLDARPEQTVMIGDSIPRDMRGAEGLGLRHALITSGASRCCGEALFAASLTELEPLLG